MMPIIHEYGYQMPFALNFTGAEAVHTQRAASIGYGRPSTRRQVFVFRRQVSHQACADGLILLTGQIPRMCSI